ncbi:TadE family protein [Hespellia stercorisuis]|uniref:TadE-like protein n=1 Tax=Hespellia stercorisuis DSM 15480 TaxID=1121950 RepID=A0A1M6SQ34_9FIRM|nr:TadE family protein [Hespellia stercorisuis]SHK46766.1 TadE-like protein [Hespellia stercorisuis DSM 15480]
MAGKAAENMLKKIAEKVPERKREEDTKQRFRLSGSATVEMAYVMPIVLLVFVVVMNLCFYYHDKNILNAIAYETAVLGSQKERTPKGFDEGELQTHFLQRLEGKMILFSSASVNVSKNSSYITVSSSASKKRMRIHIEQRASVTEPEKYIRLLRKVKNGGESQ